jgi:hypothetical protein
VTEVVEWPAGDAGDAGDAGNTGNSGNAFYVSTEEHDSEWEGLVRMG